MASIPEMGEYLVGSYLKIVEGCEVVDYNVRSPQGGMKSLNELDVVGYNFEEDRAILCEVSTHITGLYARSRDDLQVKTEKKLAVQMEFASERLRMLSNHEYQFWSPVVSKGYAEELSEIEGLELVINHEFSRRINVLWDKAAEISHDISNPAFRLMQILAHVRD